MDEVKLLPCDFHKLIDDAAKALFKCWMVRSGIHSDWSEQTIQTQEKWRDRAHEAIEATRPTIVTDEVVERVARALNHHFGVGNDEHWPVYVEAARGVIEAGERPRVVELFGHLNQATVPLSEGPQLSKAAAERLRKIEQLDLQALMAACKFPVGASVTYHDEEGAHDPCYVVLPGGVMLPLNHWDDELTDVARAVFIVRACNASIAAMPNLGLDRPKTGE